VRTGGINMRSVAVMVGFALSCFGLLLFLWLSFGGPAPLKPKGYRVTAQFAEATTLAVEAEVRVSGVPVGKVKTIEPDQTTGLSEVEMQIEPEYVPLRSDVKAILRQKTLLGETYVELTPGSDSADPIPEGGSIPDGQISEAVQLDEVFRAFDPKTRVAFQTWMQGQALALDDRGPDLNAALGNLGPFAEDTSELVTILRREQPAVQALVKNTGEVFDALSERRGQLSTMITSLDTVFQATSRRNSELQQIFQILPTFQREARATLVDLDAFARNTDPLVTQLRPAARELSPTLQDLESLTPDLQALFREADTLITASKTGFPAASQLLEDLKPLLRQYHPFADELLPVLNFIKPYKRELTSFFANTVAATQATTQVGDRRVHYLRTTNPLNPELLAAYPRRTGSNRPNAYTLPGIFTRVGKNFPVFENRHCGRGAPVVSQVVPPILETLLPAELLEDVNNVILVTNPAGQVPAPPCNLQAPIKFQGKTAQYPRVEARK
jgi:phospholipid/cholesterol/gamma-HCH transport system substrate-binding protein